MARPKWDDDEFAPGGPDPEKIPCRDCFHRKEDTKLAKGCTYGICKAYPNGKPQDVFASEAFAQAFGYRKEGAL